MASKSPPSGSIDDIDVLNERIQRIPLLRLAGFADVVNRFFDIQLKDKVNWLKTFGLVLLTVRGGTAYPSELGRIMIRPSDTITRLTGELAKEGLVRRYRRGKDRRNVQIKITPEGQKYLTTILNTIENEEKLIESTMSVADLKQLETQAMMLADQIRKAIIKKD